MMSAVTAACSMGLGTCCIGYARTANPEAISQLLKLPQHVYVVCGLAIGVPRELPDLKPKQSTELVVHHNIYGTEDMTAGLMAYDAEVTHYNATRAGSKSTNDWTDHILGYYREAMNYRMLDALKKQGFDPQR